MMIDLSTIPNNPGCYLFKDKKGKIIYVGKAKHLDKRVKSYFHNKNHDLHRSVHPTSERMGAKTRQLVTHIAAIDYFVTDNEVEALILENNLIKKNWPKYNISLKDSRRYAYIQLTKETYPRLLIARKREGNGTFYGPFVSAAARDYIREALIKIFKIRTCKKLPKRTCLRYSIGLCSAPCTEQISKQTYEENIRAAKMVLKGETKTVIQTLTKKMREQAKNQYYEGALETKQQIEAITYLEERQKMERTKTHDEDIINYVTNKGRVYLMLFNTRKGILENKQEYELEYEKEFLEKFITQYYSETDIPKKIIVPEQVDDVIATYLSKIKGTKVGIVTPKKGEAKQLLELVRKNLEIQLYGDFEKIEDLQQALKLHELPRVIECFDISHLSGTQTVASMVQFRNGKPDKNNYRKYKIRTHENNDDYASMKEVIRRRYTKLKKENLPLPNLIVIDGGKGQLGAALAELQKLNVRIPTISIAKKQEEIYLPGRKTPIQLERKRKALKLIQTLRDEAHRFAITYNRLLRKKALIQ